MTFGLEVNDSSGRLQVTAKNSGYVCIFSGLVSGRFNFYGVLPTDLIASTVVSGGGGIFKVGGESRWRSNGTNRVLIYRVVNSLSTQEDFGLEVFSATGARTFSSSFYHLKINPTTSTYYALAHQTTRVVTYMSLPQLIATLVVINPSGAVSSPQVRFFSDHSRPKASEVNNDVTFPPVRVDAGGIPLTLNLGLASAG